MNGDDFLSELIELSGRELAEKFNSKKVVLATALMSGWIYPGSDSDVSLKEVLASRNNPKTWVVDDTSSATGTTPPRLLIAVCDEEYIPPGKLDYLTARKLYSHIVLGEDLESYFNKMVEEYNQLTLEQMT